MKDTIYAQLRDKEWLYEQYVINARSSSDIAHEVGCHWSAVVRALGRHEIPKRKRTSKYALLNDEKWLYEMYVERGLSTREIGQLVGGAAGGVIYSALVSRGIPIRSSDEGLTAKYPDGRYAENAANWRGGRVKRNGYIMLFRPDHLYATKGGYVMEHRLVVEERIGRYLESDEVIHHINGVKDDNRLENLEIARRGEHVHFHFENVTELHRRIAELEQEVAKLRKLIGE